MTMRHLRQLGLLNQPRLAQLRVLVSGEADEVADVLVMLDQLGVGQAGGSIGVQLTGEDNPKAVFWKLAYPEHTRIQDLVLARSSLYATAPTGQPSEEWDVHLSFNGPSTPNLLTVWGAVSGPRAAVSMTPLTPSPEADGSTPHPLTPALRVACVAAMIERMLDEVALRNAVPISDAWVTITCRIETTDQEEARAKVSSSDGMPLSMTPTADGLATLARIRLPYPLPLNPFDHLHVQASPKKNLPDLVDIGLVPWAAPSHPLDLPFAVKPTNMIMLGVGGLGSWSAPLLVEQMHGGAFHVVDGDTAIELHNLNRQVLYNGQHIGKAKANVAGEQLNHLNADVTVHIHPEHLLPMHVEESLEDDMDDAMSMVSFDLDEGATESALPEALSTSTLFFGCLDNMRARTLLNEAALHHSGVMINGGSESVHGIVERLTNDEGCMVCRYGDEAAREEEVISCTEEGARPVASIATTTAWAGAMMAVFGLIEASAHAGIALPRLQWHQGSVVRSDVSSKPPWLDEPCLRHI